MIVFYFENVLCGMSAYSVKAVIHIKPTKHLEILVNASLLTFGPDNCIDFEPPFLPHRENIFTEKNIFSKVVLHFHLSKLNLVKCLFRILSLQKIHSTYKLKSPTAVPTCLIVHLEGLLCALLFTLTTLGITPYCSSFSD